MALAIDDYALIGDCHTAALISRDGSIDWLCLPRFDSPSIFGALLGDEEHGHWQIAPIEGGLCTRRHYVPDTFTLITRWETSTGVVEVIDLMPHGGRRAELIRRVRGISGTVTMRQQLRIRFDYAAALPWVRQLGGNRNAGTGNAEAETPALLAVAGPDAVLIRGPRFTATGHAHEAAFDLAEGETVDTVLTWFPAHRPPPSDVDPSLAIERTERWWQSWAAGIRSPGCYDAEVRRSLLVLRALTHDDTGGIVAAATMSLPEDPGGVRNWDYRYVWLRDAALTLQALMLHGFEGELENWRGWLLRAIAGDPADLQIMYGLAGERRLPEYELGSPPGYQGAAPVRIGNGAYTQYQGDIFGEVMLALRQARHLGVREDDFSWALQRELLAQVERNWDRTDNGIWEIRGPQRYFTHSRAMIWAALDCGIRAVEDHGFTAPVERWRELRERIAAEIEEYGFNAELGYYTQYYGGDTVDAALLQLPQIGYLNADDPRMLGTVAAIERDLMHEGLLLRYRTESGVDGLAGDEHPFLACSFWLAEQYARSGRSQDARQLMDRLLGFINDVGLLAEEVDPKTGRQWGNTPQALSHLALVRAADALAMC